MNRKATVEKVKEWVLKNWLLVVVGGMALLILGVLALQGIRKVSLSTPIASIEPEDSLQVETSFSRLENYRKEIEEMKKEHFRKKLAMEKIIAMDFGSVGMEGKEVEGPESISSGESERRAAKQKASSFDKDPVPKPPVTKRKRIHRPLPKPIVKKPEKKDSVSIPFYTIKAPAIQEEGVFQQEAPVNQLYKAVVDGDQKVFPNGTVSIRLLEEVEMGEKVFPKYTLVHGRLSGGSRGRLKIRISSIGAVPVKMWVYDQDYQEGIAYTRDEPGPSSLEESRDHALDQILFSVPYGGVFSGAAQAGRKLLQNNRRNRPLFLADGYPLFIGFEKSTNKKKK